MRDIEFQYWASVVGLWLAIVAVMVGVFIWHLL